MRFAVFFSLLLMSLGASAEVQNLVLSGASYYDLINFRAYGSFAGPRNPALNGAIYNSCNVEPATSPELFELGCSTDRVSMDTVITVQFSEDSDSLNVPRLGRAYIEVDNTGAIIQEINGVTSTTVTGPNQTVTLTFTWGSLCAELNGAGDNGDDQCDENGVITVFFGIDNGSGGVISQRTIEFTLYTPSESNANKPLLVLSDYNTLNSPEGFACQTADDISNSTGLSYFGICDVEFAPGDEKVTLVERSQSTTGGHGLGIFSSSNAADTFNGINPIDNSTEASTINFIGTVVCHSTQGFDFTYPWNADDCVLLNFQSPGSAVIDEDEIDGLTNGATTYFRTATMDLANNFITLFSNSMIGAYCNVAGDSTITSEADVDACPFAAIPQLVVGLISENKCFITTATYGSEQAYQVKLFREFREKFLWTNWLGLKISKAYNQYGPLAANYIYKNPRAKTFSRIALYPFYWFAWSSLKFGFFISLFGFTCILVGFYFIIKRGLRLIL